MNIQRAPGASRRLVLLIVLLVLLPVLFLSAYQIGTYSSSEQLIRDVYQRQLDVILYSLNQYAWDVSAHWAAALRMSLDENRRAPEAGMRAFLERTSAVESVVLADSAGRHLVLVARSNVAPDRALQESLSVHLRNERERLDQLLRYRSLEYRKLEPFILPSTGGET